jgi:hypothetical protein
MQRSPTDALAVSTFEDLKLKVVNKILLNTVQLGLFII